MDPLIGLILLFGGIGGLFWSFYADLPSGAAIVCLFGVLLVFVSSISLLRWPGKNHVIPSKTEESHRGTQS